MPKNQKPAHPGQPITLVLTGGGSGGHITPLLPLAHELKRRAPNVKLVYIGLKGDKIGELRSRFDIFDEVYYISSGKFRRYHGESLASHILDIKTLLLNFVDMFKVLAGYHAARRLLKQLKPAAVFSKGGFVVVPVGLAANGLKIPIITHDSDAVPGMANKLIGKKAVAHATGMPAHLYPYPKEKTHHLGIPVDERLKPVDKAAQDQFKEAIGAPSDSTVLLISGGGLGASSLNQKILAIASRLFEFEPKLYIVHITGSAKQEAVSQAYGASLAAEHLKKVKVIGFTPEFYKYTGAADLVVSRAGATTLAELALQGKAAIVIPAPHLTDAQQLKNVEELEKVEAAEILDNAASADKLFKSVTNLLKNKPRREKLAHNLSSLAKPRAAAELAELILSRVSQNKLT